MHAKRPLTLLLGASVSASAGFLCLGDGAPPPPPTTPSPPPPQSLPSPSTRARHHTPSVRELGLEQSLARDVACWISAASVYAARRAFDASSSQQLPPRPSPLSPPPLMLSDDPLASSSSSSVYHQLFGWLQQLSPGAQHWDAQQVLQSSSFAMLLNAVSAGGGSAQPARERELFRAVGALAADAQCAREIAERATRYGKRALLHLAQRHDDDARVGDALRRLVLLDEAAGVRFGPANLVSLLSLAAAGARAPDEYLEFALWALRKAASPRERARRYEWRKTLFGDDASAKTKRKLLTNDALWRVLLDAAAARADGVQLQAARLLAELSDDPAAGSALRRHDSDARVLLQWMRSRSVPLACAALEIAANAAQQDEQVRAALLASGALDELRARLLETRDCRMTAKLLRAVRCVAAPPADGVGADTAGTFALDQDALSFESDSDDDLHPLHHDDFVVPDSVARLQYVDGWIELFTALVKSDDEHVRAQAALCLQQIASTGAHTHQSKQEWLIAILDAVLQQVPPEIARASTSVRDAKLRTRPIAGHAAGDAAFETTHAKALRALAFVLGRKECQQELVRLGGISLLKLLLASENLLVQRETARVLANLFSGTDVHAGVADFVARDEQLTAALETWTQSEDLQLQSLAHRARSNRRFQRNALRSQASKRRRTASGAAAAGRVSSDGDDVKYLDGVHPLHLSSTRDAVCDNRTSGADASSDYDVDVVFLHGLLGCPFETWMCGEDESTVWANKWLLDDLQREGRNPRLLSIGYDSQLLSSESAWRTLDFEATSEEIALKLAAARVGAGGRPVVFVTHSLGGVLLKQVLHDAVSVSTTTTSNTSTSSNSVDQQAAGSGLVDSVRGVVFYGVPHHGSPVAQTIRALQPQRLGIEQHPVTEHLHGTPHSAMLNDWCAELFAARGIAALSIGETLPCRLPVVGLETVVVPAASANPGFGDFVSVPDATHMSVCKPSSPQDVRYTLARDFIVQHARVTLGDEELGI